MCGDIVDDIVDVIVDDILDSMLMTFWIVFCFSSPRNLSLQWLEMKRL